MLPVFEAAVLAVLINALSLRSDADRGTAHPDALQQADLTRFAEPMEQGVCGSSYVRQIQGAGRADRLIVRVGIMQSVVLLRCKLRRHFGGVALHNSALHIIGEPSDDMKEELPCCCCRINVHLMQVEAPFLHLHTCG